MTEGFFLLADLNAGKRVSLLPACGTCGIYKTCNSPKMKPSGKGRRGILIVGEAPGEQEDRRGEPFVGPSGMLLKENMRRLGLDPMRDCWFTNALICRPPGNKIPKKANVGHCRPNLLNTIEDLRPDVVILLGATAVSSMLEHEWKENLGGISRWAGWKIPSAMHNAWVCPTFHPSYLLRQEEPVLKMMFEKHLEEAVSIKGKPWREIPDYQKEVEVILSPSRAAVELAAMMSKRPPAVSFDFETDRLKPDARTASIVCCSVSTGRRTIAYPWHGPAIKASKEMLLSDTPKVGWNICFEQRWSMARLGLRVNNWIWDGMIASHTLDNRRHITGLKFQSFVRLGAPPYDEAVKRFLKSKGRGGVNRIKDVDMESLCLYCGLDSYFTMRVARMQRKEMGYA